ncbi:MAG: hypothetical protein Q8R11_02630 [bacterium]|nr:hypothetical protein [bacterium]
MIKIGLAKEDKDLHTTEESISVSNEYIAIGKMIHEALGESRIIHERDSSLEKTTTSDGSTVEKTIKSHNEDVVSIKATAEYFLEKVFGQYKKERVLRLGNRMIQNLFFLLYFVLSVLALILLLLANKIVVFNQVETILFSLTIITVLTIVAIGICFIFVHSVIMEGSKND